MILSATGTTSTTVAFPFCRYRIFIRPIPLILLGRRSHDSQYPALWTNLPIHSVWGCDAHSIHKVQTYLLPCIYFLISTANILDLLYIRWQPWRVGAGSWLGKYNLQGHGKKKKKMHPWEHYLRGMTNQIEWSVNMKCENFSSLMSRMALMQGQGFHHLKMEKYSCRIRSSSRSPWSSRFTHWNINQGELDKLVWEKGPLFYVHIFKCFIYLFIFALKTFIP